VSHSGTLGQEDVRQQGDGHSWAQSLSCTVSAGSHLPNHPFGLR
jgi:hypothetical protein